MEIRIESCKGTVVVDSFAAAGEWLEEMQPSTASVVVAVRGVDVNLTDDIETDDMREDGAFVAQLVSSLLRRAHSDAKDVASISAGVYV